MTHKAATIIFSFLLVIGASRLANARDLYFSGMGCSAYWYVYAGTAGHRFDEANGRISPNQSSETMFCDIVSNGPHSINKVRVLVKAASATPVVCELHTVYTYEGAYSSVPGAPDSTSGSGMEFLYLYPPAAPGADLANFVTCHMVTADDAIVSIWVDEQ